CVQPDSVSHFNNARSPVVVVSNVRHSRFTLPPIINLTQATTIALCTSRPAQRSCNVSIMAPPRSVAGVGTSSKKNSNKRAPGALPPLGSNGGDRGAPGPTQKRALPHHRENRPLCRRRPSNNSSLATPRVSFKGVGQRPVLNLKDRHGPIRAPKSPSAVSSESCPASSGVLQPERPCSERPDGRGYNPAGSADSDRVRRTAGDCSTSKAQH